MAWKPPRLPIECLDAILTTTCNMSCSYCYQNNRNHHRMSWATLRHCIDLLLASNRSEAQLVFYGGEPLLEFPLIRRAVAYAESASRRRTRLRYGLVTNGVLLDPKIADFLEEHHIETHLSFDGILASQNFRARGTFRILDGLLDSLQVHQPEFFRGDLVVSVTIHSRGLPYLADSIAYFLRKGVRSILLGPTITQNEGWGLKTIDDLDAQFARIWRTCLRHYRRTGDIPLVAFRKDGEEETSDRFGLSLCGVGRGESISVDPDGEAHGCVMFADVYQTLPSAWLRRSLTRMRMEDIRDRAFVGRYRRYPAAARAARIFDDRHLKHSSYGRCASCRFATACVVCPVAIGHIPGSADRHRIPDNICAFNLVSLKYRERFPSPPDAFEVLLGEAPVPLEMRELRSFVMAQSGSANRRGP